MKEFWKNLLQLFTLTVWIIIVDVSWHSAVALGIWNWGRYFVEHHR